MRLRTPVLTATILAALASAGPADAAFFPAETVDQGVKKVGDLDVARDSGGAVAYVKNVAGVDHVFVSRVVNGQFQTPEQVDAGLSGPGSDPTVAVSNGGRVAVAYVSGGTVYTAVRPADGSAFTAPQAILPGQLPSIDMSINGVAYVSFTAPGTSAADVRAARLDAGATTFALLPDSLDITPGEDAGLGGGRSDIAVSADGTAVVVFGEAGHLFARRVFDTRVSSAPQDLTVPNINGHGGDQGAASDARVDMEDDSSFAWVTFRQRFDDNQTHTIARRLVGSAFDPALQIDGLGFGGDQSLSAGVQLNGRGEGLAATGTAAKAVFVSVLHDDTFFPAVPINAANNVTPNPLTDFAENGQGYVAWMQGTTPLSATVRVARYTVPLDKRTVPGPAEQAEVSNPAFGPVDPNGGFDVAVDRSADGLVVFLQGLGDGKRLVAGGYDRPPGLFNTSTTQRFRKIRKPTLAWAQSFDLWGPLTYTVQIDGVTVGETSGDLRLPLKTPLADGVHPWKVIATDRHGQSKETKPGLLRVDTQAPTLDFRVDGVRQPGRVQTVRVSTADPKAPAPAVSSGSGVARVVVDFGDGHIESGLKTASHAYAGGGTYTVRVSSTDKAGNVSVLKKSVTLKTPKKKKKKKK